MVSIIIKFSKKFQLLCDFFLNSIVSSKKNKFVKVYTKKAKKVMTRPRELEIHFINIYDKCNWWMKMLKNDDQEYTHIDLFWKHDCSMIRLNALSDSKKLLTCLFHLYIPLLSTKLLKQIYIDYVHIYKECVYKCVYWL